MPDQFGNPYPWELAPEPMTQIPPWMAAPQGMTLGSAAPASPLGFFRREAPGPSAPTPGRGLYDGEPPPGAQPAPQAPRADRPLPMLDLDGRTAAAAPFNPRAGLATRKVAATPQGLEALAETPSAVPTAAPRSLPSDPLSRLSPEQQAKLASTMVSVGGSGGGVRTATARKQTAQLPGYQEQLDRLGELGRSSILDKGAAEARQARDDELAYKGHLSALQARQDAYAAQETAQQARIAEQEARYAAARSDVASMKVDPDAWMASRSVGQKVSLALGAAISGFMQGFNRQQGPNATMALIESYISRDIEAQKANIAKKGAEAQGERGVLADLNARLGDMRQSEIQARQMMFEGLGIKLKQIASTAQDPIATANAEMLAGEFSARIAALKNASFALSQGELTTHQTKIPGSPGQRVPLLDLLRRQQIQGAQYNATMAELKQKETKARTDTEALEAPTAPKTKAILEGPPVDVMRKVGLARDALARVRAKTQEMWTTKRELYSKLPGGSTWKTRLDNEASLAGEAMSAVTGRPAAVETKALIGRWDNNEDVRQRLTDAAAALESQMQNYLETSAPKFDVSPFVKLELQKRKRMQLLIRGQD